MNNLPNCVPQEQYCPDYIPEWHESAFACPECDGPNTYELVEVDYDGFETTIFECDSCGYHREV